MIDYYETRSQPITRVMVWQAYKKVKANKGGAGIDEMSWSDLDKDLNAQLYKLWNRLSSGSYFPMPVKEVEIRKKSGGVRRLGIPAILDRIAQQVIKSHLEQILEPLFHEHSFGYRPSRSCHLAVERAKQNIFHHDWAIDLDIKAFFDELDHELLMQALSHYCKDRWILLYVERWLKAGIVQKDGCYLERVSGTPQGDVISPLLANLYLHVAFDGWMQKCHPDKPFVRYADDIVVHCKSEKQAHFLLDKIRERLSACKLRVHPGKTKIVNLRGRSGMKYVRSFDFLGFTLGPRWSRTGKGMRLMPHVGISRKSVSSILEKFRLMHIHKWRSSIEELSVRLKPVILGVMNYYCISSVRTTVYLWNQLNLRLLKWVKWEKSLPGEAALRWLRKRYRLKPDLFPHWKLVYP